MSAFVLSTAARQRLLAIVRRALARGPRGTPEAVPVDAPAELRAPGAAFVTLRRSDGELRGCVGYTAPRFPLGETVARAAHAAAYDDTRFLPVAAQECAGLRIEISVLGPLVAARPEDVEVGRHGLVMRRGGRSGLLLPQVPVEQGWDRTTFLAQTCRKAGLPQDAWRADDCQLQVFEALVFGEERAVSVVQRPLLGSIWVRNSGLALGWRGLGVFPEITPHPEISFLH